MPPRPLKTLLISLLLFSFAWPGYAQTGTIDLGIISPAAGHVVDSNAAIQANIISTYQISTVTASAKGRSVSLTPAGGIAYTGTLSLAGLPAGVTDTLTVVATDINGNSQTASGTFIYDQAPKVTIVTHIPMRWPGRTSTWWPTGWRVRDIVSFR